MDGSEIKRGWKEKWRQQTNLLKKFAVRDHREIGKQKYIWS